MSDKYEVVTYDTARIYLKEGFYKLTELEKLCKTHRKINASIAETMLASINDDNDPCGLEADCE